MLDEARAAGVSLVPERVDLVLGRPGTVYPAARELLHKPTSSPVHQSLTWKWWVLEFLPHIFYDKDYGEEHYRIPLGARRKLPKGALIHHSVKDRMNHPHHSAYRPANLLMTDLEVVANPSPSLPEGKPLLYRYEPKRERKSNPLVRFALLFLFLLLDVLVGVLVLFAVVRLCVFAWPYLWCFLVVVFHWLRCGYLFVNGVFSRWG